MKKCVFVLLVVALMLSSCSKVPDKTISEKLETEELAKAIKSDTLFAEFYEGVRVVVAGMSDIKKATYNDVTYRRLFKYVKFLIDTDYWEPLEKEWAEEWEKNNAIYTSKVDSIVNYWERYIADNSLDKYVKIELVNIDKEWYEYIGEIKEVNLGFRLTPLQGTIEQICFNYGYNVKINEGSKYYEKHKCMSTSPFSSPITRYWEVGYSDRDVFANKNVETFLRDYNMYIEVTKIRKNGVNISKDDFDVPKSVSNYLDYGHYYEDEVIKELINSDYISKDEYCSEKANDLRKKKDKLCFDFLHEIDHIF